MSIRRLEDELIWSVEEVSCLGEVRAGILESLILEVKGRHGHIPQIYFKIKVFFN